MWDLFTDFLRHILPPHWEQFTAFLRQKVLKVDEYFYLDELRAYSSCDFGMRASHPATLVMKPLCTWNIGCGSTGLSRCYFRTTLKRWAYFCRKKCLYISPWYGISFCVEQMFVGSILSRAAHLPRLDERVRVHQLKMRSVHFFLRDVLSFSRLYPNNICSIL